jgi:hypothetical protein
MPRSCYECAHIKKHAGQSFQPVACFDHGTILPALTLALFHAFALMPEK